MVVRNGLAGLVAVLLIFRLSSLALAQEVNIGVSPAQVDINDLPPGETAEFELTVHNNDETAHNFTVTTFQPQEEERREGRAAFPDDSWISFSSPSIEIVSNSQANVTVTVAVPREQKWAGRRWEIWLGVTPESSDLLGVKLYVRLLVSTSGTMLNPGLVAAIAIGIVLLGYGLYHHFRRRPSLNE